MICVSLLWVLSSQLLQKEIINIHAKSKHATCALIKKYLLHRSNNISNLKGKKQSWLSDKKNFACKIFQNYKNDRH